jgi:dTMP kinase
MKFFVIEGIDGSGKSTQVKMLIQYLENRKISYQYLHFPRTESPVFGEMIARFLRGDFGPLHAVDPYLVALLYAGDRHDGAPMIRQWINDDKVVLLDRYVYSNIAFQCAKVENPEKRKLLRDWIMHLEFEYYGIPRPDLNLFLDVPFDFTVKNLTKNRDGKDREYLLGNRDIHEDSLDFQKRVREMYLWQVEENPDFRLIDCTAKTGGIKATAMIFEEIVNSLEL